MMLNKIAKALSKEFTAVSRTVSTEFTSLSKTISKTFSGEISPEKDAKKEEETSKALADWSRDDYKRYMNSQSNPDVLTSLPKDIFEEIIKLIDVKDYLSLRLACKSLRGLMLQDQYVKLSFNSRLAFFMESRAKYLNNKKEKASSQGAEEGISSITFEGKKEIQHSKDVIVSRDFLQHKVVFDMMVESGHAASFMGNTTSFTPNPHVRGTITLLEQRCTLPLLHYVIRLANEKPNLATLLFNYFAKLTELYQKRFEPDHKGPALQLSFQLVDDEGRDPIAYAESLGVKLPEDWITEYMTNKLSKRDEKLADKFNTSIVRKL